MKENKLCFSDFIVFSTLSFSFLLLIVGLYFPCSFVNVLIFQQDFSRSRVPKSWGKTQSIERSLWPIKMNKHDEDIRVQEWENRSKPSENILEFEFHGFNNDDYKCFSSFILSPIMVDNVIWPSANHYFQVSKITFHKLLTPWIKGWIF